MKRCFPDYQNSIANLACSVLKYYGIAPPNATLSAADELLAGNVRNVVVLLLDGMGTQILQKHLKTDGFFRRHLHCDYCSTFPPTTVAATTAIASGLHPNQSAWLGWVGYFPQLDRNVVYFMNKDNDTKEALAGFHAAFTFVPYVNVTDRIRQTGINAREIAPFREPFPQTYDAFCSVIEQNCTGSERTYLYAYWPQPDYAMHRLGTENAQITEILTTIEKRTEMMANRLENTLLLITADHGMIDTSCRELKDLPDLLECLVRPPSMEARAVNWFVKKEKKKYFEKAFIQHFSDQFLLLPKQEVLDRQLLGTGQNHEMLESMLGDYLSIATGTQTIRMESKNYIGEHAGLTEAEMTIPLIAVKC